MLKQLVKLFQYDNPIKLYVLMDTLLNLIKIAIALLLIGCSVNNSTDKSQLEKLALIGEITFIEEGESYQILVEENPEVWEPSEPGGSKIILTLSEQQSEILIRKEDGRTEEIAMKSLEVRQKIEAWTRGFVQLSHPMQGNAARVIVLE